LKRYRNTDFTLITVVIDSKTRRCSQQGLDSSFRRALGNV